MMTSRNPEFDIPLHTIITPFSNSLQFKNAKMPSVQLLIIRQYLTKNTQEKIVVKMQIEILIMGMMFIIYAISHTKIKPKDVSTIKKYLSIQNLLLNKKKQVIQIQLPIILFYGMINRSKFS